MWRDEESVPNSSSIFFSSIFFHCKFMCIFVCLYACTYNAGLAAQVFFQGSVCFFFTSSIVSYVPIRMFVCTYVSLYNVWMILLRSVCNCICFSLFCLHVCSVCADKQKKSMLFLYVCYRQNVHVLILLVLMSVCKLLYMSRQFVLMCIFCMYTTQDTTEHSHKYVCGMYV